MRLIKDIQQGSPDWDSWTITDLDREDFAKPSAKIVRFLDEELAAGHFPGKSRDALLESIASDWVERTRTRS